MKWKNIERRKLVSHPGDWEYSSRRFYECDEPVGLKMEPVTR